MMAVFEGAQSSFSVTVLKAPVLPFETLFCVMIAKGFSGFVAAELLKVPRKQVSRRVIAIRRIREVCGRELIALIVEGVLLPASKMNECSYQRRDGLKAGQVA